MKGVAVASLAALGACFDAPPRPLADDVGDAGETIDVGADASEIDADAPTPSATDVALVIGRAHACAAIDGAVWCWGDGADGRLGDGSATPGIRAPARVADASAAWLGARHTCFDGPALAWCVGTNTRAQVAALGSPVWWPAPASPVGELVVGYDTTCVVAAGALACRGERLDGQVGSGDRDDDDATGAPWFEPRPVLGVTGLTGAYGSDGAPRVAVGAAFGCAVVGGEVRCWGSNAHDALGRDGSALGDPDAAPTAPLPFTAVEIGAGSTFACARGDDGAVACWGDNRRFQAGAETGDARRAPGPVTLPAATRRLAMGRRHACALLVDDRVACWGDNTHGQLGVDDTSASAVPVVVPLDGVVALAAGWSTTCAARADGEVLCWGDDGAGALGRGAAGPAFTATPTPITLAPTTAPTPCDGCAPIAALAAGADHACALAGEIVWCWGRGGDGRLGRGAFETAIGAPFPTGSGVTRALALGRATTCGLSASGAVWCTGGGVDHPTAVALEPAVAIAAHADRTCALGASGALWCWGHDRVAHAVAEDLDVDAPLVAVGADASCARASDGAIVCWGDNDRGQLGRAVVGDATAPAAVPAPIAAPAGMSPVDALAGADRRFCALAGGVGWCWGANDRAALGLATTIDHAPAPTPLPLPAPVTAIALGPRASCAVAAGEVFCWGDNRDAALALPIDLAVTHHAHRVRLGFAAARVAVGDRHACAGSDAGHLVCWGADDLGQLGAAAAGDATPVPRALTLPAP